MCNLSNEVPQLFDWDQQTNQPADRWQRAELNQSVVDFIAPTEYMVRPPQPPVYVFIIDVSYTAIHSGTPFTTCSIFSTNFGFKAWSLRLLVPYWNL